MDGSGHNRVMGVHFRSYSCTGQHVSDMMASWGVLQGLAWFALSGFGLASRSGRPLYRRRWRSRCALLGTMKVHFCNDSQ